MQYIVAFDLGTSGIKASLHDATGQMRASSFASYPTYYSEKGIWQEQSPIDWWEGFCKCSRELLDSAHSKGISKTSIAGIGVAGHSLVTVPLDKAGNLVSDRVPIWSDRRAIEQANLFFKQVDYSSWYLTTGNGDPAENYSIFKLMWMRDNLYDLYQRTEIALGSKDFINYKLTGCISTDYSYASGSGAYNLKKSCYEDRYIEISGVNRKLFANPVESHIIVGEVTSVAEVETGFPRGIPVVSGGVDNACMALGSTGNKEGSTYIYLGSSCWITFVLDNPIVDTSYYPFVFESVEKGKYISAVSNYAGGSVLSWLMDILGISGTKNAFKKVDKLVLQSPIGSHGVICNPSFSGNSNNRDYADITGTFLGLNLSSTVADLLRAVYEGNAMDLFDLWNCFPRDLKNVDGMIMSGGGSVSDVWMQIFSDIFNMPMRRCVFAQNAGSFGAAAIVAKGINLWSSYEPIYSFLDKGAYFMPEAENTKLYAPLSEKFVKSAKMISEAKLF